MPEEKQIEQTETDEGKDEEKQKKKKSKKSKASQPPMTEMLIDALESLGEKKGSSIQAIKAYIMHMYDVRPETMKYLMKRGLTTGLKDGTIVRPPDQAEMKAVLSGRYVLGKVTKEAVPQTLRQKQIALSKEKKTAKKGKSKKKKKSKH